MNPSLEYLEHCSAETGYQVAPLEKVIRLGELAADIARHPVLEAALALKGGTALNLCFVALRKGCRSISTTTTSVTWKGKRCWRIGRASSRL